MDATVGSAAGAGCTSFILTFMFSAINLALPDIGVEFNASAVMVSWIITVYTLAVAALLLPLGHLADTSPI